MKTCSPKTGQHMEYAGKVTQENAMKVKQYYMQYGWWKALWLSFCVKPIFPYFKGLYFNLTIMVVETSSEKVNPNLMIPIKSS